MLSKVHFYAIRLDLLKLMSRKTVSTSPSLLLSLLNIWKCTTCKNLLEILVICRKQPSVTSAIWLVSSLIPQMWFRQLWTCFYTIFVVRKSNCPSLMPQIHKRHKWYKATLGFLTRCSTLGWIYLTKAGLSWLYLEMFHLIICTFF